MDRKIFQLKIADIKQLENARITYTKTEMAELMVSMKQRGLLSPIGVRELKNGKWEVVFGNRRLMAAKKLGWEFIECMEVSDVESNEDMLIVNAVENMQREDVPFSEQGRIFHSLEKSGLSPHEIAARIGIDARKVKNVLRVYNELPKSMRPMVSQGRAGMQIKGGKVPSTTAGVAMSIGARLKLPKAQVNQLIELGARDGFTGQHMRNLAALVRQGYSYEKAKKLVEKTRVITVSVAIKEEKIAELEKKFKMTIHELIYEALKAEDWLGVITAAGSDRLVPEKHSK